MALNMKNTILYPVKKKISRCDVHALDHTPKAPRAVWAQYAVCSGHFQNTTAYLLMSQSENKKLSWSV